MDSPRRALPSERLRAEIIAQREAAQRLAAEYGHAHFVWPTGARPAFYWYAVEAAVSMCPDDIDLLPAVVVEEGFARTEDRAHRAALSAFGLRAHRIVRLRRCAARIAHAHRVQPRHAHPAIRGSRALRLACMAVLAALTALVVVAR